MGGHARVRSGVVQVSAFDISADMEARWHASLSRTPPRAIGVARRKNHGVVWGTEPSGGNGRGGDGRGRKKERERTGLIMGGTV